MCVTHRKLTHWLRVHALGLVRIDNLYMYTYTRNTLLQCTHFRILSNPLSGRCDALSSLLRLAPLFFMLEQTIHTRYIGMVAVWHRRVACRHLASLLSLCSFSTLAPLASNPSSISLIFMLNLNLYIVNFAFAFQKKNCLHFKDDSFI